MLWYRVPEMTERKRRRVPVGTDGRPMPESVPVSAADAEDDEDESCDCPVLEPGDWDSVESDWSDITFLTGTSKAMLGVPTGLRETRDELRERADALPATVPEDAMVLLGEGRFRRPVMLEVEDAPEGSGVTRPGGIAFTRLVEAPLGAIKKAVSAATADAKARYGRSPDDVWVWYLTCRKCSARRNYETLVVAHYRDRG